MAVKYPKVVVLILSFNGKHLLEEAITSYLANDYPNFEVVVIDNGSKDGTFSYVRRNFEKLRILRTDHNLGYSGGFNLGLEFAFNTAKADYVLVTNNDVKADTRAVAELVELAEKDKRIGFVTGKVYYYDYPDVLQTVGFNEDPVTWEVGHIGRKEKDIGQYDQICERSFTDDVYTLVRRALYEDIGGYNDLFFLQSEQYDWQLRARKRGYKIMFTPFAKLWHKDSMTIGKGSALVAYYDARNSLLVRLLHESPQSFRRYFWFHLRKRIIRGCLVAIKQGRLSMALAKLKGLFSAIGWGVKRRKYSWNHFVAWKK